METPCPFCGERTPAEPDAQWVYCIHCTRRITIDTACAVKTGLEKEDAHG